MKKITINTCYGGFSLSAGAIKLLAGHPMRCGHINKMPPGEYYGNYPPDWQKRYEQDKKTGWIVTDEAGNVLVDEHGRDHRDCRYLAEVVEDFGEKANGSYAELKVVEIPDDVEWEIEEHDGYEWVSEKHRRWG